MLKSHRISANRAGSNSKRSLGPSCDMQHGSRHLCHFGCSSILPPDLTAKMTALANIKQSGSPIPNKLINSTVIAFVSVTISKKEIECDPAKYWRCKHQASSPPEGSLTYSVKFGMRSYKAIAFPKILY